MINRIPKFHEVIESFYSHGLFKMTKVSVPPRGLRAERRRQREQALVEAMVVQLAGAQDEPLLSGVLSNWKGIHLHLGVVTLFPDKEVSGTHYYFWLILWPQIELMLQDALKRESCPAALLYLAHCYQAYGTSFFNDRSSARRAILKSVSEQLGRILSEHKVEESRAKTCRSKVDAQLGRLIRAQSFVTRTTVTEMLSDLDVGLGKPTKRAKDISQQLVQILMGGKIIHACGGSPFSEKQRPKMSDELRSAHHWLYHRPGKTWPDRPCQQTREQLEILVNAFKKQIKHQEPDDFLSDHAREVGSKRATQILIAHNEGQFHPYVLLQQIKNDLSSGPLPTRVNNSVKELIAHCCGSEEGWRAFFQQMPASLFLLNAVFSSSFRLIELSGDMTLLKEARAALASLGKVAQAPVAQRDGLLGAAAREQIIVLKKMLDVYHSQHHLGRVAMELSAFLYAFKYKYDPGFQPNALDTLDTIIDDCIDKRSVTQNIVYETPFTRCERKIMLSGSDTALVMIQHYNRYVRRHCMQPDEYLCNPLERLSDLLANALGPGSSGQEMDRQLLKSGVNGAFGTAKEKSILRIGGVRPYECLRDVRFYLQALDLEASEVFNPGLFLYEALPEPSQHWVLQVLSEVRYAQDASALSND